jgi:hypothetical protein
VCLFDHAAEPQAALGEPTGEPVSADVAPPAAAVVALLRTRA